MQTAIEENSTMCDKKSTKLNVEFADQKTMDETSEVSIFSCKWNKGKLFGRYGI